ncbi:unnamed protein product [Prorocentrum cordatum]|uniref:Uncharacterized protein n=1 Tax=Prorocentrum cordatum TaxID=2364126 RepID=A0ABN9UQH3_9DINO|nr:unnamed protein product [Polarella glacialis]
MAGLANREGAGPEGIARRPGDLLRVVGCEDSDPAAARFLRGPPCRSSCFASRRRVLPRSRGRAPARPCRPGLSRPVSCGAAASAHRCNLPLRGGRR